MKTLVKLAILAFLAWLVWNTLTRPVTGPEWFLMQLGCSNPAMLNDRSKIDCWLMLNFNRVLNVQEAQILTEERVEALLQGQWSVGTPREAYWPQVLARVHRPLRKTIRPEEPELHPAKMEGKPLDALSSGDCRWPINEASRGSAHLCSGVL